MGKFNSANLKKTFYYLKRNGLKETWYAAVERLWGEEKETREYKQRHVSADEWNKQREWAKKHSFSFSIVVPAYRTDPIFLREMIDSVKSQSFPFWELILADATEDESIKKAAESCRDKRVVYLKLTENKGISENTNAGILHAGGEYIGLLDHDDVLEPDALYKIAAAIQKAKEEGINAKLLYSDEDKFSKDKNACYEPNFKEKYNYDLILTNNYVCHFMVMESELIKRLELRKEFDGAQDYDLVLRAVSELKETPEAIVHVPEVLYHWRCHENSTAENPQSKLYAYEAGRRALQDFADRSGYRAKAVSLKHLGFYRLDYAGDIFGSRKDLGAVGGRLVRDRRVCGGCMDAEGNVRYQGLKEHQSGYLHRAVLSQDAEAVDIRCIRISPAFRKDFEKITGAQYKEDQEGLFDFTCLPKAVDYIGLSLKMCAWIRERGAGILYLPEYTRRLQGDDLKICKITKDIRDRISREIPRRNFETTGVYKNKKGINLEAGNVHVENDHGDMVEKITVVIPNFNGIHYLEGCMNSLLEERRVPGTPQFEILVVDNHSTDGSEVQLREMWPEVKKIFLSKNTGFCHAVNLGIQKSSTPYVILLNNDTKVRPGFIKHLYEAIKKRKNAFSVSAAMLMWDDPGLLDDAGDLYTALGWAFARGKGKNKDLYDKRAEIFSACAGAAIYRKKIFDRIGLFDERHFAYMEDLDIGYRARIYGYRNFYEPKAEVIHFGSASTGSRYNEKKTVLAAQNNVYVIFKNMPIFQRIINLPFLLTGFCVKYLFFCKKKMGRLYLKGILRGLKISFDERGRDHRVPFNAGNLGNYIKIQAELYGNIFKFLKKS